MRFKYFLGNEKIKEQISALLDTGRLPHAVILEGEQGMGKHVLAREIAAALVCRSEEKPCYICSQCKKAVSHIHPDIFEYTPEGGARSFHKEMIQKVIDDTCMSPNEAPFKVYILANAHLMSESAQNAILKILEEPPSYVRFILTVDNKSALLQTVLSRSVVFTLEGVNEKIGAEYITEHDSDADYDRARQALSMFNGNIGRAMESLKDGKAAALNSLCIDICTSLVKDNEYELLKVCSAFQKDRQGILDACSLLRRMFRDALLVDSGAQLLSSNRKTAEMLACELTRSQLLKLTETVGEVYKLTNSNANNALIITKFCYALRQAAGR